MIKRLNNESGYSLVEVMVSIMILTVAIIPMVGMFDMGLKSASTSGNYDTARALANKKVEQAKGLPYAQVRDNFPYPLTTPPTLNPTDGSTTAAITSTAAPHQVPAGFSYTVRKRHMKMLDGATPSSKNLVSDTTDAGMIEVKVTVTWGGTKSYTTTGIIAKDAP